MENIKQKYKKVVKYFISIINSTLLKKTNKSNNTYTQKTKFKVSQFNKYIISLIGILFIYLFYLTIPSLYNKIWVQNIIESKLSNDFKINFSISSNISYEILPSPNFTIKNVKIINNDKVNSQEISEIKELKVFINQKNFFKKTNLDITKIIINEANFIVQNNNFGFYKNFLDNKFSNKKMIIKNSNIFFKDQNNETISITQLKNVSIFYDINKLLNKIFFNGEVFNIPFFLDFENDLINQKETLLVNSKKFKIKIKNDTTIVDGVTNGLNETSILNLKLFTKYKLDDHQLIIESKNSLLPNNKIIYNGKIDFDPFNLLLNIKQNKIDMRDLFNSDSLLFELLKSRLLLNDNLSAHIFFESPNVTNHKILNDLKFNFFIKNSEINFENSEISLKKIGKIKLKDNRLVSNENDLLFIGDINLKIYDANKFYSFFQVSKKNRRPLYEISLNLNFNILEDKMILSNLKINNSDANPGMLDILNDFNNTKDKQIVNFIEFKNLIKKIFIFYEG